MVMRNMKHLLPILALICLLRPTTSSAMVRPLPCATEAASFSSTSLQPQSEYVLIPFDFDCDFARQSCRNDPVDFTDPLGLAWWETDNARFNRYSAWRIGASGSPEVRRVNNGKVTWQEADRSERQWFFTQENGTWGTVSRGEAERRFVNNAHETLVAGQKMVETWATAEFAIAGAAPAAAEGGLLAVAEELFYDQTIGINPRNVVGLVKSGWRKAASFLERIEIPRGQLNSFGVPKIRLKPKSTYRGGKYSTLSPEGGQLHRHHMPAKQSSPLAVEDGPAIQMSPADHRRTASYGGRPGSSQQAYRDVQKNLIDQGRFDDAFQMDIDDVQSKFQNAYDDAILEAIDDLPE